MPSTTVPAVPRYVPAPPTKEDLNWADLPIVDFSRVHTPEGLAELVPVVRDAMHTKGFLYVVNHGLTPAQNARIFDIGDIPFSQVEDEEKKRYAMRVQEMGIYRGYKPRQYLHIDNGVHDQIEHYNVGRLVDDRQDHPKALRPFVPEMRVFNEHNHHNILIPILKLLALGLELLEDTFADLHKFDSADGETWLRFQKYYPYPEQDSIRANDIWMKGHTDATSVSILWSQPIAALQTKFGAEDEWRWVRHIDNALVGTAGTQVVNIGDGMEMLSGGFYKSAIHRVVQPPPDQRGFQRLCVFYFALADGNVKLVPCDESPVLQRVGIKRRCDDADAPTMIEWFSASIRAYTSGKTVMAKTDNAVQEEEIVKGVFTTHYN